MRLCSALKGDVTARSPVGLLETTTATSPLIWRINRDVIARRRAAARCQPGSDVVKNGAAITQLYFTTTKCDSKNRVETELITIVN